MSAEEDAVVVVVVLLSPCAHRAVSTFLQTGHVASVIHLTALQFVSDHNRRQKFPSSNLIAVAPEGFGEEHYVTRVELQSAGSQPLFAAYVSTSKPTRPIIGSFSVFTGVSDTKDPAQVLSFEGEEEGSPPTVIFGIKGCSDMCGSNSVSKGVSFALRALLSRKSTADDEKACDDGIDEDEAEEEEEVDVDDDEDDEDNESEGKVLDDQDGVEDDADDDDEEEEE